MTKPKAEFVRSTRAKGRSKSWSEIKKAPVSRATLQKMGRITVKYLKDECKKDFAKRGWSGRDPMGGKPIWDSFSFVVRGDRLEFYSSFYGMVELARGDIPEREMTWLTQEAKDKHPDNYPLSPQEKKLKMKKSGRVSRGERLPLIVPLEVGGSVIFRVAPLKMADAWIHPGIAKFNFFERAIRKGRKSMVALMAKEIAEQALTATKR